MTRRRKLTLSVTATLAAVYLLVFWVVGLADFFILHASTNPITLEGGRRTAVPFHGTSVELWSLRTKIRPAEEDAAYVLEFIPNAGRAEYASYGIGKWEGRAIEYVSMNYPGYGGSGGKARLADIPGAALAAYDAVAARAAGKPIFVSGYSLGTTAALHVAAHRPVAGLLLQSPPPLRELLLGNFGWWNLWLAAWPVSRGVPAELDSLANSGRCTTPAFFILSEQDTLVPYAYQKRVYDAYAGPKRELSLAMGHNGDPEDAHRDEVRSGVEWLWERR